MKNRVWRKKGEGLKFTVKGSKNLADGHWLHLIVAMAYGKYVVLKEVYKKLKGLLSQSTFGTFYIVFAESGPKRNGKGLFYHGQ